MILTYTTTYTARRKDFDLFVGIEPNCFFANWAAINAVTAIHSVGTQTDVIVDFSETDLNFIDAQFLQCPTRTHLHTLKRIADDARLIVWIDVRAFQLVQTGWAPKVGWRLQDSYQHSFHIVNRFPKTVLPGVPPVVATEFARQGDVPQSVHI